MEQEKGIVRQIRESYDALSKSHRRLADFILENIHEVAFLNIKELSQKTGTSPATITRFARRLGFQGYPDFQRGMYEQQKEWTTFSQLKSLIASEATGDGVQSLFHQTIQSNIRLLEQLYASQVQEAFERSLEILQSARTIHIVGLRSSYTAAYYLAFMLQQMYENVNLLNGSSSDLPAELSGVHPQDCLVAVAYARYTSMTYDIVSHFHRLGCRIVSITDSFTSPIALKSTEVMVAPNGEQFSPAGAITLCNCFITSLGRLDSQRTLKRMELQEKIALEHNVYL